MTESRTFPEDYYTFTYTEKMGLIIDPADYDSIHPLVSRQSEGLKEALTLDAHVSEDGFRIEAQASGDPVVFDLSDCEVVDFYLNTQRAIAAKMERSPAFREFYHKSLGI